MPELPEVESVRNGLQPIVGRRIIRASLFRRDMLESLSAPLNIPRAMLQGRRVERIDRVGKQLGIIADGGSVLGIHLGMTGQMIVSHPDLPRSTHDHAHWVLDDGLALTFRDPRRFGGLRAAHSASELFENLGPDALEIRAKELKLGCGNSTRSIKAALLDQRVLAGVGNIYADESLFRARIRPSKECRCMTDDQFRALAGSIRKVLSEAISYGGSTLRDYRKPDGERGEAQRLHRVYGRAGMPCINCQTTLKSDTIGQRTTVWCPRCQ